jgi:hypothetical protein
LSSSNNQNGSGHSGYCPSSGRNTLSDGIKLIELDEEEDGASTMAYFSSDEFSSLSGYESIETGINNVNSVFYRNRPEAAKEIEFVQVCHSLSFCHPIYVQYLQSLFKLNEIFSQIFFCHFTLIQFCIDFNFFILYSFSFNNSLFAKLNNAAFL